MKKLLCLLLSAALALGLCVPALASEPAPTLRVIAPKGWELGVGESRTLDYVFENADGVTERRLNWASNAEAIATVDEWGRVTGVAPGEAEITATPLDTNVDAASVTVTVAAEPTAGAERGAVVDYAGAAIAENDVLQKVVTRYASGSADIPANVKAVIDGEGYTNYQSATTADDAVWTITEYGVLRKDDAAANERDKEMRFMGDRYFYEKDTTTGKVLGIIVDGANGIWTIMANGVTHIAMVEMSYAEKASQMSNTTQQYVSRRGLVSEAYLSGGKWIPAVTDNDGLWTAMYGAGELFRYAALREALAYNPLNTELQRMVAEAKKSATLATEAVLLLANISMRGGDVDALVKHFADGGVTPNAAGKWPLYNNDGKTLPTESLLQGGNYSLSVPSGSPKNYNYADSARAITVLDAAAWSEDPAETFATQKRSLGGFLARTYYIEGVDNGSTDAIYFGLNEDGSSTLTSTKYGNTMVNGDTMTSTAPENVGVNIKTDSLMDRLWNDVIGSDVELTEVTYKGDTSTDEIIGHLFLYKIAYDVFKSTDPELAEIIAVTMDNFAQHLSDNEYMLVDATGLPTTWGKLNREYFYTYRWGASSSPLTSSVLLCAFKTAAYVTGYQKWENEYQLLLTEGAYLYDDIMATHSMRDEEFLNNYAGAMLYGTLGANSLSAVLKLGGLPAMMQVPGAVALNSELSFLLRSFAQYSDEEMAMLAFYLLFQMEKDTDTLETYRNALDQWWNESIKYSENPLWYYIYQLAYPTDKDIKDYYGNSILETAAWSLSRHPIDTRKWDASNKERDDIMIFDLEDYSSDLATRGGLSIEKTTLPPTAIEANGIIGILLSGGITYGEYDLSSMDGPSGALDIKYAVAAPDERAMHKYNNSSYKLDDEYNPSQMEGSTTYTLPYWMGVYHGMLKLSDFAYVPPLPPEPTPSPSPSPSPTPAGELFDDVAPGAWYHDAVTYVANAGLFEGDGRLFSPNAPMTRSMLATVLWRMEGSPKAAGGHDDPFDDVAEDAWYHDAVLWAAENKIVEGLGGGKFAPADPLTREQMVTMLCRYAAFKGVDVSVPGAMGMAGYQDVDEISDWAYDSMRWAVLRGLVEGDQGRLTPGAGASRAQVAALLQRSADLFKELKNV